MKYVYRAKYVDVEIDILSWMYVLGLVRNAKKAASTVLYICTQAC